MASPVNPPVVSAPLTISRRAAVTLYAGTAVLGIVGSPLRTTLVEAPVAAALAVSVCLSMYRSFTDRWPSIRTLQVCGSIAFGLPLYVEGARALGGLGSALTIALLAFSLVLAALRIRAGQLNAPSPAWTAATTSTSGRRGDVSTLRTLLATVPLDVLFDEWRATGDGVVVPDEQEREARRRVRALIIDELQRRDPAGVERWLAHGGTDPPERYITPDPPPER